MKEKIKKIVPAIVEYDFICPRCDKIGLYSIYVTNAHPCVCTACSNELGLHLTGGVS